MPSRAGGRDTAYDLLVPADPVWETAFLLEEIPPDGLPPGCADPDHPLEECGALARISDCGGSALNTAAALAAAGRRVLVIGSVGDDEAGENARAALESRGMETRLDVVSQASTTRLHLYVTRTGANTAFQAFPGGRLPPSEIGPEVLLSARFLLVDEPGNPGLGWMRRRKEISTLRNALNLNLPPSGAGQEILRRMLPLLDYLQVPEDRDSESRRYSSVHPPLGRVHRPPARSPLSPTEIDGVLRTGLRLLVRTDGAHGIVIHDGLKGAALARPARSTRLVDPTGAGDALAAGLLDALMEGHSLDQAGDRGLEWAARACRYLGARAWLDQEPPG